MSKFKGAKTDNAKIAAKSKLRENLINVMPGKTSVLEIFCGKGEMYDAVWHKANRYTGIDKRFFSDHRHVLHGDALSVVSQIDCSDYNIFDIDAYGSPYDILLEIVTQLSKKNIDQVGFCITDGVQMDLRMGNVTKAMSELSGLNFKKIGGAHRMHDQLIIRIIDNIAALLNGYIVDSNIAIGATGSGMRYYTFIVEKTDQPATD